MQITAALLLVQQTDPNTVLRLQPHLNKALLVCEKTCIIQSFFCTSKIIYKLGSYRNRLVFIRVLNLYVAEVEKVKEFSVKNKKYFTFMLPGIVIDFLLNNQPDALIIQIYSVIKLYMFRASSLPIIRSFLLYIRHW